MSNPHVLTPAATIVVRLYRCDPARVDGMAGIAEIIATGRRESFGDGNALLAILHREGAGIHVQPGPHGDSAVASADEAD